MIVRKAVSGLFNFVYKFNALVMYTYAFAILLLCFVLNIHILIYLCRHSYTHIYDDIIFAVEAFAACGGNRDKSGHVERSTLVKIIKQVSIYMY